MRVNRLLLSESVIFRSNFITNASFRSIES